jgi:hypothetical protein
MFVPLTGLNVIEDGCRRALSRDRNASAVDALIEAVRSSGQVLGAGW